MIYKKLLNLLYELKTCRSNNGSKAIIFNTAHECSQYKGQEEAIGLNGDIKGKKFNDGVVDANLCRIALEEADRRILFLSKKISISNEIRQLVEEQLSNSNTVSELEILLSQVKNLNQNQEYYRWNLSSPINKTAKI